MDAETPELIPVEPGYKNVLRAQLAMTGLFLMVAALVLAQALQPAYRLVGMLPLAVLVLAGSIVAIAPQRIYRRLRYGLSERWLQVMRGWLFHSDTVVPLVRVQHLDVVRGPFDKLFGTASLVVHTAGTRNSTITVPGLAPDRAAQMRDIIREHVRTDFA
jgi:membrane protein YdbS with pleckstrin-like domain